MSENEVKTKLTIAAEGAVRGLRAAQDACGGLLRSLNTIKNVALGATGIGGLFEFRSAAVDADKLYGTITKLRAVTGATVGSLDAMVDVLEKGGVEGEAAEQVIIRMTKALQSAAGAAALTGEQSSEIRKKFRLLGIDIKNGPQAMLVQMAKAAADGKMQVVDVMKLFRMGPEQAAQMMTMLREGPAAIKATMDAQRTDSSRITAESLAQYQTMLKAKRLAKDAVGDTFSIVYRTFLPGLTTFFQSLTAQLNRWQPAIEKAMNYLSGHMEQVLKMAERIALLSAATGGVEKLTGKGVLGNLQGIGKLFSAGEAAGGIAGGVGSVAAAGGALAAAVLVAYEATKLLARNWNGIRDSLVGSFRSIYVHAANTWRVLGPPLLKLAQVAAKSFLMVADKMAWWFDKVMFVVEKLAWVLSKILDVFNTIIGGLMGAASWIGNKLGIGGDDGEVDNPTRSQAWRTRGWNSLFGQGATADILEIQRKLAANLPVKGLDTTQNGIVQDFRGSKFEVKQEFAEGFDAGKVVVAMADRLASLGERRLQSGFAPLYGVR